MDIKKKIIQSTTEYFEDTIDYSKLFQASKAYSSVLNELCEEEMNVEEGRNDIEFENGKALGTYWAALCVDDLVRTRNFIRGIDKAIKEKLQLKKTLHILYAGTGPFAALMLPLILRFSTENIKYTLLEINPFSFRLLKNTFSKVKLEGYNINFVNEDATKYIIDSKNEPDIIISETMQNALAKEQQVPIFLNMMSQIKGDAIFIPEKIEVSIGLRQKGVPFEELQRKHYHKENTVFEVSKALQFPAKQVEKLHSNDITFPKKQTVISNEKLSNFNQLLFLTEIQVYKDEKIRINESGLTTPMVIQELSDNPKGSLLIDTQYQISLEPKLEYKITVSKNP